MELENSPQCWRRLPLAFGQKSAGEQLALSEALLVEPVTPTLWWYSARETALILGASQKQELIDLETCRAAGIEIYRRTSGGSVVLAEPEFISLDVALPPGHLLAPSDIVQTYRWLGTTWLEALKELGLNNGRLVSTEEVRAERETSGTRSAEAIEQDKLARLVCFGSLSPYEVVAGERKLVGLAQIRRRAGTLLQCGLPLRSQVTRFAPLLALSAEKRTHLDKILDKRITSLDQALGRVVTANEVVACFEKTLAKLWNIRLEAQEWPELNLRRADQLAHEKFKNLA